MYMSRGRTIWLEGWVGRLCIISSIPSNLLAMAWTSACSSLYSACWSLKTALYWSLSSSERMLGYFLWEQETKYVLGLLVGYHHRFGDVSGWYVASEDLWLQRRQRSSRRVARRVHEVRLDGGERGLLGEPGGRTQLQEAGDRQLITHSAHGRCVLG
ncbi:hypothetical protein EYF80_051534 [Liparis tanakae]|uniref:Uncharacterized protein n=1 Tax=Liparis tanakae TaxID=230148 RepID=A0A4Z2FAX3_9TELE|nr:hypothetical protein EYF80_051534 [Liparis tanakae]